MTRYVGRDPRARIEDEVARVALEALDRETRLAPRLPAGPGRDPPRRRDAGERGSSAPTSTSRRSTARWTSRAQDRAVAPAAAGPAQDRARHLDRRDLADDRRRARRDRQRAHARAALRARHRPDPARDGAGVARQRRPAPRPRRPRRAGRLLSAVGGGGDRRPRALRRAGNPVRRPLRLPLDCAVWGVRRSRRGSPSSTRRRAARSPRRARCSTEIGALDADGRITDEGRAIARLALPPRLARMVVDAAREGEARTAAEIAVAPDRARPRRRRGRSDEPPRSLPPRPLGRADDARRLARGLAQRAREPSASPLLAGARGRAPLPRGEAAGGAGRSAPCSPRPIPTASRMARGKRGEFLMANGRAAALEAHDALAGEPYARHRRDRRAAPLRRASCSPPRLSLADVEAVAGASIETADELTFDRASASLRARRRRRLGALTLAEQTLAASRATKRARAALARGVLALGRRRGCRGARRSSNGATASMFLRRAEGDAWPDLSDERAGRRSRLARAVPRRQNPARRDRRRRPRQRAARAAALGSRAPARRRGADPFPGADRHGRARSTTRPRAARRLR